MCKRSRGSRGSARWLADRPASLPASWSPRGRRSVRPSIEISTIAFGGSSLVSDHRSTPIRPMSRWPTGRHADGGRVAEPADRRIPAGSPGRADRAGRRSCSTSAPTRSDVARSTASSWCTVPDPARACTVRMTPHRRTWAITSDHDRRHVDGRVEHASRHRIPRLDIDRSRVLERQGQVDACPGPTKEPAAPPTKDGRCEHRLMGTPDEIDYLSERCARTEPRTHPD